MNDVIASAAPAPTAMALAKPSLPAGLGGALARARAVMDQPAVKRARPAMLLLGLLGLGFILWSLLATPAQRDLSRGLGDADKAAIADALSAANIKYHIDGGDGAVSVADGDYYRAKMLLAQQGLPKAPPTASDTLASLPMGASRAVEGERLLDAREADLARTIETIDAVQSAKIHLATEQPSVFLRDQKEPAASVMLKLQAGRTLTRQQVQAIASLVASSVPGLSPEAVSIVDQAGHLLSRGQGDPATAATDRQVELQGEVEQRYQEALDRLLIPLVGAGNYTAQVHADLDFSEVQATRETYPKDLQAVRQENGGWTKEGGPDGPAVGIPGALSNTPPPASTLTATNPNQPQPPAAGANGQAPNPAAQPGTTLAANEASRTTENYTRTYELGREVSVTKNGMGGIKRLSVAVAIADGTGKNKRNPADIAAIEKLVRGAVGADQARGDVVAVSARAFVAEDASSAAKSHWWQADWVPLVARNLSALLVAALVVFGVVRPLMKRRAPAEAATAAASGAPAKPAPAKAELGKQIAAEIGEQRADGPGVTLDMIESAPGYQARAALIRDFVKQDPARAALVVRDLIRADGAPKEDANG